MIKYYPTIHKCLACGMKMIRRSTGVDLLSYPPQYPWNWWCGCGHTVEGGVERAVFLEDSFQEAWERLNQPETPKTGETNE